MTVVDVLALGPADLAAPVPLWDLGVGAGDAGIAVIDGSAGEWNAAVRAGAERGLGSAAVLTVGVVRAGRLTVAGSELVDRCDLVVRPPAGDDELLELLELARRAGAPAVVAAQLLRVRDARIVTESFAYSMLLSGADFRAWRARETPARPRDLGAARLDLRRTDDAWVVTLSRPSRHNAYDGQMREALCDALDAIANAAPAPIVLLGAGRSFCSGGDLDEFGSAENPVTAHLVRTGRSVARRLERVRERLVVGVQGHCIGAGVEFAAFARRAIAETTAAFALPELSIGLNLGAGGAVSIPARIGRHRTLELLMRSTPIDAATALRWGLVDEVVAPGELVPRCMEAARSVT